MGEAKRRREAGLPPRRRELCFMPLDGGWTVVLLTNGAVRIDGLCGKCDREHWIWEGGVAQLLSALLALRASPKALAAAARLVQACFAEEDGPPPDGLLFFEEEEERRLN